MNNEILNDNKTQSTKKNNSFAAAWIATSIVLVICGVISLFAGVFTGIKLGYENPKAPFDFGPYATAFIIFIGLAIVFNVIMIVIYTNRSNKN